MERQRKKRRLSIPRKQSPLGLLCLNKSSKWHMNFILKTASAQDVAILNASKTSPILQAIIRCASTSTKKGCKPRAVSACCAVIQTCLNKNIDLSLGMPITGTRWALPIVSACRFSMLPVVALLLDAGQIQPEVCDTDGITGFHAAFNNPSNSKGNTLRQIDIECIQMFVERGLVTANTKTWQASAPGSTLFVGVEDISKQSTLYSSIVHKNDQAVDILLKLGARISDNSLLMLYNCGNSRKYTTRFLKGIVNTAARQNKKNAQNVGFDMNNVNIYDTNIAWSFPPQWYHSAFTVMQCWRYWGLPADILRVWLMPYFSRVHFYSDPKIAALALPNLARVRPNLIE